MTSSSLEGDEISDDHLCNCIPKLAWSQNSKNMRESLYTSVMTIAGSDSCSYGTANVTHLLIVKLMGHSIYYFEALLPQCLVQQLPIYNHTTFTCHNHN